MSERIRIPESLLRRPSAQEWLCGVLLLAVLASNAVGLWPELAVSRVDLNDSVSHFTVAERMVQAAERGENPLDCWSPEWSFGYPMLRVYQTLPHGVVALAYFLLGKTVSLMTIFVWVRFLAVVLLPLSFYRAALWLDLGQAASLAAAMLAPLISTNGLYGLEYGSYVWAGSGLFPQAVATHFLLLALGLAFQALRSGKGLRLAGVLLGLTFLCHFIYGYIGALSICLLAVMPCFRAPLGLRIRRTAWVAVTALLLAAFQLAPLYLDGSWINHSRWEPAWKWDSFGGGQVAQWLVTGELLDHGRLPVLTVLAVLGALLAFRESRASGRMGRGPKFVLSGAALWLLMFCGRPLWGPLVRLLGVSPDMQMHRLIGGVHVFLLLAAGLGLAGVWRELARRKLILAIPMVTALLLYPMLGERAQYLHNNAVWGRENLAACAGGRAAIDATISLLKQRGGRVYPGLAAGWGGQFKVGSLPLYAFLSVQHVPAVAFLYHSMALTGDLMVRFNEWNAAQYRLFAIRTAVAPAGLRTPVPAFWTPGDQVGRFQIYQVPDTGYFDIVDVPAAATVGRATFFDINDRWLASDWVGRRDHLWLDWHGDAPAGMPRLGPGAALPPLPDGGAEPGRIVSERQDGEVYQAECDAARPSHVLFKMTWHPNWKVYIDGAPVPTVMLSPGFTGAPVPAGRHRIVCRYESGGLKVGLAILCLAVLLVTARIRPPGAAA